MESKTCYMKLLDDGRLVFTSCESVIFLPNLFNILRGRPLHEVVVYNVNSIFMEYLHRHLVGDLGASTLTRLLWKLRE